MCLSEGDKCKEKNNKEGKEVIECQEDGNFRWGKQRGPLWENGIWRKEVR